MISLHFIQVSVIRLQCCEVSDVSDSKYRWKIVSYMSATAANVEIFEINQRKTMKSLFSNIAS